MASGRVAYVDYRGKMMNRYTLRGCEDEFNEEDKAAFVNPSTDNAPIAPAQSQHMIYKHHGGRLDNTQSICYLYFFFSCEII